jgi:hypothetical protein
MKKHIVVLALFALFALGLEAAEPFVPTLEGYVGYILQDTTIENRANSISIAGEVEFIFWDTFFLSGGASSILSISNGSTLKRGTLVSEYADAFFSGGFSFRDVNFGYKETHLSSYSMSDSMWNPGGVRREIFFSFETKFGK